MNLRLSEQWALKKLNEYHCANSAPALEEWMVDLIMAGLTEKKALENMRHLLSLKLIKICCGKVMLREYFDVFFNQDFAQARKMHQD